MERSRCTANARDGSYAVVVEVERYPTRAAANARWVQVDHPDFTQLAGVADGAYLQADVQAGVRHGTDIAFVSGVPRGSGATAALEALTRAVAQRFAQPTATDASKPGPNDPDPCGYQQLVPLPAGATLTSVRRVPAEAPFAWACTYETSDPSYSLRVQTTTAAQLAQAGLPPAQQVVAQLASTASPGAQYSVVAADGTTYSNVDQVPPGAGFDVDIAGADSLIQYAAPASRTAGSEQVAELELLESSRCRALVEEFKVRSNLPFSDAALAGMIIDAGNLRDCWQLLYGTR